MIALIVALGVLVVLALWAIYAYNSLVRVRNEAETGWANIDVQLRRRADLIPNLVEPSKATPRTSARCSRRSRGREPPS